MHNRRQVLACIGGLTTVPGLRAQSMDQAKIICPYPPGGTSDMLSRRLADKLRGHYAGAVLVDNKPGAAGGIGIAATRDAPADGSVMMIAPASPIVVSPFTFAKLPYDPGKDLAPVSLACQFDHGIGVGPLVPARVRTLQDFLKWARANPDQANYGSPAAGSMPHLIASLVARMGNTPLRHVAYRGSAPGIQDLLGGQIAAMASPVGDYLPHLAGGRLRLLAISGPRRSALVPQVPYLREAGFPVAMREWYGIFMPGRASPETLRRASAYLQTALSQQDLADAMAQAGMEAQHSTPQAFADVVRADTAEWRRVVKTLGFTAET